MGEPIRLCREGAGGGGPPLAYRAPGGRLSTPPPLEPPNPIIAKRAKYVLAGLILGPPVLDQEGHYPGSATSDVESVCSRERTKSRAHRGEKGFRSPLLDVIHCDQEAPNP